MHYDIYLYFLKTGWKKYEKTENATSFKNTNQISLMEKP